MHGTCNSFSATCIHWAPMQTANNSILGMVIPLIGANLIFENINCESVLSSM